MKDIFKIMIADHDVIDRLINSLQRKGTDVRKAVYDLKNRLKRHFAWEEEVLFPAFEEKAGAYATGIVYILKSEHRHIEDIFLKNIIENLDSHTAAPSEHLLYGLKEIIKMHKEMEEDVCYPWFEKKMDEAEKNRLVEDMKKRPLSSQ